MLCRKEGHICAHLLPGACVRVIYGLTIISRNGCVVNGPNYFRKPAIEYPIPPPNTAAAAAAAAAGPYLRPEKRVHGGVGDSRV